MRTSAPVALWWKPGLLNHTAEPLKSLAVGSSQSGDQTSLGTLLQSKKTLAGGRARRQGGEARADVYLMQQNFLAD